MKFTIIGLNVIKYVGEVCGGHNCHFVYEPDELEKYVLFLRNEVGSFYELSLEESYGECGSGWTTASWGHAQLERVYHIGPFGYKPKQIYTFELEEKNGKFDTEEYVGNVFSFSYDGGDKWYPSGWANVDLDKFEKLPRCMDSRPVWIFKGGSGLGKTSIAYALMKDDFDIFETDSCDALPDVITADVVVVGNRKQYSIDDIKERLFGEPKVIIVNFN